MDYYYPATHLDDSYSLSCHFLDDYCLIVYLLFILDYQLVLLDLNLALLIVLEVYVLLEICDLLDILLECNILALLTD